MFDGHTDGHTNWKKFKKWALSSKRPSQFQGFMNGFPYLYERAILWTTATPLRSTIHPVASTTVKTDNLIDFTIEDTTPTVVATPVYVPPYVMRQSVVWV
jgi:hypothetical protein